MPFEHKGKAELVHINVRKGTGEDSQATVDLKLKVEGLPLTTAATALGVENPDELKRAFFHSVAEDAQESARFLGLKSITTGAKWEGKHGITLSGFRRLRAAMAFLGAVAKTDHPFGRMAQMIGAFLLRFRGNRGQGLVPRGHHRAPVRIGERGIEKLANDGAGESPLGCSTSSRLRYCRTSRR